MIRNYTLPDKMDAVDKLGDSNRISNQNSKQFTL